MLHSIAWKEKYNNLHNLCKNHKDIINEEKAMNENLDREGFQRNLIEAKDAFYENKRADSDAKKVIAEYVRKCTALETELDRQKAELDASTEEQH